MQEFAINTKEVEGKIMQRKKLSSWKILVVVAAANLLAVAAQAAPDAPHDAGNSIGCLTCHQMTSTYPKLLPPNGGTLVDMDDTYANRMCISCHDGSGSSIVLTDTHSSLTMSNKYGDWTVECWVCHNGHLQEQNRYNSSTYGMYIRRNINLANIKKPDGTSLKTGTKSVVFTGPATFADGNAVYNGICEVCHTQTTHFRNDGSGSNQNHDGKQGSDCVSCHNHSSGFTGGAVHNTFIADDNKTGDPGVMCSSCHTDYATSPETAHSACTVCHTTAPDLFDNTFATYNGQPDDDGTSMFTNLSTGGYLNVGTGRITDAAGNDITGTPAPFTKIKCGVCHAAKPDALAAVPAEHGGHPVTDWDYSTNTNDCLDCHADGGNGTVQGVHSNNCTLCHVDAAGGDFTRKAGVDGSALLATGRTGDCLTCHPGATYTKTKIHHDTANAVATPTNGCTTACHNVAGHKGNHNTLVAIQNPPCQGCHNAAAASGGNNVPVDATSGNLIHDYCTSCHVNPSNDLIGTVTAPTAHATTMNNADGTTATNNGGGTCTACHTAYFDSHEHKTAHTMPTVALCLNCHTATTVPYTDAGDVHNGSGCMTCHAAATGALQGSAVAAVGGENCQGCHTLYFNGHGHSHTMPTVALCASCHTASAAPYTGAGQVHAGSSCATCHDLDATPTGSLIGSATGKVGGEDCQGCHAAYFDGHEHGGNTASPNHTESITKDALCGSCHGNGLTGPNAIIAPYTAAGEVHTSFGCMTCHDPSNGAPLGTATNWGATWNARANGTCVTCHTDGFGSHGHSHSFTATPDCATCHGNPTPVTSNARDAADAPFVGIGEVHETSGCATCHDPGTGALIGAANGHAAATGCIDCHTATWTNIHDTAAGVTHATRVETDAACTTCHGNPTPVTSNARDAQATPYIVAGDVHATGCALCHTGNNNGGLRSSGLTNADTVAKGTCTTCHLVSSTWSTIHTGATGLDHTARVDEAPSCVVCHTATAGGPNGLMPVSAADNKVHDTCTACHTAVGALNGGNTTYGGQPIAAGDCDTCHGDYFDTHVHGTTGGYVEHDVTYTAGVDLAQDPAAPCANCHIPTIAGTLGTWAGVLEEHVAGCGRCHNYVDDGQASPPQAANDNAIASGVGVTCVTCHTEKLTPLKHGGHDATHFAWTASCGTAACHDSATNPDVANDIHGDGTTAVCTICHSTSSGGSGTAKVGDNGDADATLGVGAAPHASVECITCHDIADLEVTPDSLGGIHHNRSGSVVYDPNVCSNCHGANPAHTTQVVTAAACTGCHDTTPGGYLAKDAITSPFTGAGEVHSALGCVNCHDFNAAPGYGGSLRPAYGDAATLSNNGTEAWVNGADGGGQCTACHTALKGSIHHNTASAANNNCTICHDGTRIAQNHTSTVATQATCIASTCHTSATVGTATSISVDPVDGLKHKACRSCHTFNGSLSGVLKAAPGTKGVNNLPNGGNDSSVDVTPNGGGSCIICHNGDGTAASRVTFHHQNTNTSAGNCDYCHYDHRPDTTYSTANINATTGLDNSGGNVPTHLPCEECHVKYEDNTDHAAGAWSTSNVRVAGYNGTSMTVVAWNKGSNAAKTATRWTTTYARTNVHVIPNTQTQIDNWGICITCHDGTATIITGVTAAQLQPYHALPTSINNRDATYCSRISYASTHGKGQYLPGKTVYNQISNMNYYGDDWRPTGTGPAGDTHRVLGGTWTSAAMCGRTITTGERRLNQINAHAKSVGKTWLGTLSTTVTEKLIPNPWTGTQANNPYANIRDQLPIFAPQTPATDQPPAADRISVTSALISGANLNVVATVTNGNCVDLTLQTGAGNVAFNASCQASIAYSYPANGTTINVVSSQEDIEVTNYPITP